MGSCAQRLAALGLLVVVLAGCRIDVVLHDQDPLPGGLKWEADDVEMGRDDLLRPLNDVSDVAQGPAGVIHVADFGNDRVRRIGLDGVIRTVAGGGTEDPDAGGLAILAQLDAPWRIAYDGTQNGVGDELWLLEGAPGDLLYVGIR
jgi:hypothetical protein